MGFGRAVLAHFMPELSGKLHPYRQLDGGPLALLASRNYGVDPTRIKTEAHAPTHRPLDDLRATRDKIAFTLSAIGASVRVV